MYEIAMHDVTEDFASCWQSSAKHIQNSAQGGLRGWLKADLEPPFLEHLSFQLGNQLFFIRIEDADRRLAVPGTREGLLSIADGCHGHPCILPMQRREGAWFPFYRGWGLVDARTGVPVEPPALVNNALIEMTDWEIHDFAVQIVAAHIKENGRQIMSIQGNPGVNPSIWFIGDKGPEWVVVRATRFPELEAPPPKNLADIAKNCERLGKIGHFASVSVANMHNSDSTGRQSSQALWRGHPIATHFRGLVGV